MTPRVPVYAWPVFISCLSDAARSAATSNAAADAVPLDSTCLVVMLLFICDVACAGGGALLDFDGDQRIRVCVLLLDEVYNSLAGDMQCGWKETIFVVSSTRGDCAGH